MREPAYYLVVGQVSLLFISVQSPDPAEPFLELDLGWELPDFAAIGEHPVAGEAKAFTPSFSSLPSTCRPPTHSVWSQGPEFCPGASAWILPHVHSVVAVSGLEGLEEHDHCSQHSGTLGTGQYIVT